MIPGLETDRLLLCPLELADAEQVQQIFPRWEIVRYLANVIPWPYPADGAVTYYRDVALPAMASGEQWHWTLRPRSEPQRIIGQVSLMTQENHNRGFWLSLPWQGKGIMSEAVEVVTDYSGSTLLDFAVKSHQCPTKPCFQADLREKRDAYRRRRRESLR